MRGEGLLNPLDQLPRSTVPGTVLQAGSLFLFDFGIDPALTEFLILLSDMLMNSASQYPRYSSSFRLSKVRPASFQVSR